MRAAYWVRSRCLLILAVVIAALWLGAQTPTSARAALIWTPTGGPEGGSVTSLAVNPTSPETVFAGTTNGVFRTADAGAHWVPVWAPDARDVNVSAIAVDRPDPATIYAMVEGPYSWSREGLLRSTDSGETWERVPSLTSLVGNDPDFFALALVRGQGTSLLVAVNGRLYASDDGGGSWTELGGLPRIWTLWVDPHSPTTVYTRGGLDREGLRSLPIR